MTYRALRGPLLLWLAALAAVLLIGAFATAPADRFLWTTALLYALLAMSWNLTLGVAGIFNFAHIAFFALGAYTSAILTSDHGWSPWLGLAAGAIVGGAASVVAFVPVVRLRGIYVALTTFVFSQIVLFLVIERSDLTGGASGKVSLPPYAIGDYLFLVDGRLGYLYTAGALFLVAFAITLAIVHSSLGRGLIALRDHEDYALSRGVPAFRLQLSAFVIGSSLAGATGAVYAHFVGVASPELFSFGYITLVLSMIVLGGMHSPYGPVLGAVVITFASDRLAEAGAWRTVVISSVILVVLWLAPRGLAGALSHVPSLVRASGLRRGKASL